MEISISLVLSLLLRFAVLLLRFAESNPVVDNGPLMLWADAAVNFVKNLTCDDAFLTTRDDCKELLRVEKSSMNVYVAEPTSKGRLMAILPDGPLNRMASHDSVLVLDPYPEASIGHLLIVFFLDFGWSELQCELNGGKFIGGLCLSVALKKRCHNLLLESKLKLKYLTKEHRIKVCEINFFPLVYIAGDMARQDKLKCRNLNGFASCPILRSRNETELICDPLQLNTKRCSTSQETLGVRCRLFERCDHGVLLSGGWNRLTSRPVFRENILGMRDMLRENGFLDENIKAFYANGDNVALDGQRLYPSAFKFTLRYHLQKICQSPNCADTLVLYLNSPTRNDGSSLLWDIDGNGQADENEVYTVRELLYDIQNCSAQAVYIIADQSYAGRLLQALEHSERHTNVIAFASGDEQEYSWNGEYTRLWRNFNHVNACVEEIHQAAQLTMTSSTPLMQDGSNGAIKTTIFGAPCKVLPPFTLRELQKDYYGCQNLPSSVWLHGKYRN